MPRTFPPSLSRMISGEDISFEAIATPGIQSEYGMVHQIKQDITGEEEDDNDGQAAAGETMEEKRRRKSMIGAYRSDQDDGLPAEKGFAIQIGSEVFRLSGASIMSDAPSYFSKFFEEQISDLGDGGGSVRTLYIDRDPETFRDIARHLQGYHIHVKDGRHYVRLFADAQFYSLPRLNKQLANSDIHIQIGEQDFKIPKDTFSSAGDSPNFFSLGFGVFLTNPDDAFPGLDRVGLIRPPPIEAPRVLGKSASTFTELLHLLRGYPLHIRDTQHRAELVQDCRYFHLKGLEQKLVLHDISYNPQRQSHEIVMRIEDLRQTGISVHEDTSIFMAPSMCVRYARPYADNTPYDLIVEIGEGSTTLDLFSMRAEFFNNVKLRITSLFQVIANRISATKNLRDPLQYSTDSVQISTNDDTYVTVDGKDYPTDFLPWPRSIEKVFSQPAPKKRKTVTSDEPEKREWMIMKGQWRIQVLAVSGSGDRPSMNVMLHAVRLEVLSGQVERNKARGFLA